jgi:hypothetical protein
MTGRSILFFIAMAARLKKNPASRESRVAVLRKLWLEFLFEPWFVVGTMVQQPKKRLGLPTDPGIYANKIGSSPALGYFRENQLLDEEWSLLLIGSCKFDVSTPRCPFQHDPILLQT